MSVGGPAPATKSASSTAPVKLAPQGESGAFKDKDKPQSVRSSNIVAAKAVADAVRTSLGPRGMDKMIQSGNGEVTITNDGATILAQMSVIHPTAKMLVELSKAQDIEAGDGTTTVVVVAGALLDQAEKMLAKGIHPTTISESFQRAAAKAQEILEGMSTPVDMNDEELIKLATTSLNSKVVSQHSWKLAPMAVEAMKKIADVQRDDNVNLNMIKLVKKLGETVEESELIDGALIEQRSMGHGGPSRIDKAKIGLIQFQISPPKTNMENQVVISDYAQMDRALKEERAYTLDLCKQIKKAGCNVLMIQKSILRDAISELALHFFAKMKIMVIKDIEREDIEFYSSILGCRPIASVDHFNAEALGQAELVEEITTSGTEKVVKVTGLQNPGKAVSILLRGSNKLVLDEADRSLHDALCVLRCLVKKRALLPGGGAPEMEVAVQLRKLAEEKIGAEHYCWKAFAEALEVIPYTLAENAGLSPIVTVTELRNEHANGNKDFGVNVRKGYVTNIRDENVLQPLLVTSYAIKQAAECVRSILKIDDIVLAIR
ncbi:T-complex protein 1 subunit delta [Aphelenchoides besseyi]|nr:T-complex protein 1 subunit delta [Aphelenchoides besseyi]